MLADVRDDASKEAVFPPDEVEEKVWDPYAEPHEPGAIHGEIAAREILPLRAVLDLEEVRNVDGQSSPAVHHDVGSVDVVRVKSPAAGTVRGRSISSVTRLGIA